jgi:PTS system glucitol/sorbitol-specific IIA component
MSMQPVPIYELEITTIGPLAAEMTAHDIWVFFHEHAPEEVAEFSLLHRAHAPLRPIAPGQILEIGPERYTIHAVGPVVNANLMTLGHMVLKANGATDAELPGDICIEARPLPHPRPGMVIRIWDAGTEGTHGSL